MTRKTTDALAKSRPVAMIYCLFLSHAAFAQIAPSPPAFDVAAVKRNKSGTNAQSGGILPGGQFSVTNISMLELLHFAYGVDGNAISGIPAWFESDHFDVTAKGPANTSDAALRLMLRSLLASEFKLKLHQEQKTQDAFVLVVASSGSKLQQARIANPAGPVNRQSDDPNDPNEHCKRTISGGIRADCTNISMAELAKRLPSLAPGYIDRPVVDRTGMSGTYDLKLQWSGRGQIDADGGLTIFEAITKQLGLRLEQRKVPLPGIVIDHAERLAER